MEVGGTQLAEGRADYLLCADPQSWKPEWGDGALERRRVPEPLPLWWWENRLKTASGVLQGAGNGALGHPPLALLRLKHQMGKTGLTLWFRSRDRDWAFVPSSLGTQAEEEVEINQKRSFGGDASANPIRVGDKLSFTAAFGKQDSAEPPPPSYPTPTPRILFGSFRNL